MHAVQVAHKYVESQFLYRLLQPHRRTSFNLGGVLHNAWLCSVLEH